MTDTREYFSWKGPEMFRGMTYEQEIALFDAIVSQAKWVAEVADSVGKVVSIQDLHRAEHPHQVPQCTLCSEIHTPDSPAT